MNKNVLSFDEAISLFHVRAYGFKFQTHRGDTMTSEFDSNDGLGRLKIIPVEEEETPE